MFVGGAEKAVVQFGFYVVARRKLAGFAEDLLYFLADFGRVLQGGQVVLANCVVYAQAFGIFGSQNIARGEDGAFVDVDEFERHGLFALREQGFFGGVELFAQGVGGKAQQVA